jgi:peptide chain release factor 1
MAWPQTVRKEDFDITYYRGSGPGGQHRNKTDSAVRFLHRPTGNVTQSEEHKKQGQNKKAAFKRMCDILVPLMKEAAQPEREPPVTDRIRTYHEPRQRVKDHRSGKSYSYKDVMDGHGLEEIINDMMKEVSTP